MILHQKYHVFSFLTQKVIFEMENIFKTFENICYLAKVNYIKILLNLKNVVKNRTEKLYYTTIQLTNILNIT